MVMTAAAYARYSTDNQTENSIAYQMHEITGYCAKNNIKLTHSFIDEGESGTNMDRDGFQDMMKAARSKEFTTIIIYDVSRGSRDIADWFNFRKQMRELGITVISCHQQLGDPLNPDDFLREFITVGLGHHMVLETRQKSMDGMSAAAREAKFLGGIPPYGYAVENQKYVIVPTEAEVVRKVFRLYYEGYSYNYIMKELGIHDIVGRHGAKMNKNSLYYMLKNPRYAGIYIWNQYTFQVMRKYIGRKANPREVRIEGAIPAIVPLDIWEGVQERLEKNQRQNRRVIASKRRIFLLSGLITCGICGAGYVAHCSRSKGHEYTYYSCSNRYGKKGKENVCQSEPIHGEEIEKYVIEAVKKCIKGTVDFNAQAVEIAEQYNNLINSGMQKDVSAERAELQSVTQRLNNGIQAVLDGLNTPELAEQINELKGKKAALESVIASADTQRQKISIESIEEMLRRDIENIESKDPESLRIVIQRHVASIIVNDDGSISVTVGYIIPGIKKKKPVLIGDGPGCTSDGCGGQKSSKIKGSEKQMKTRAVTGTERVAHFVAGAVRMTGDVQPSYCFFAKQYVFRLSKKQQ